jgi:hypothetical protein
MSPFHLHLVNHHGMARSILSLISYIALAIWQIHTVRAADVNYQFNIINADIATDGFTRNAILVNNQFPGTLIQANKEDTLHMNVSVQLDNPAMRRSTSIHVSFLPLPYATNARLIFFKVAWLGGSSYVSVDKVKLTRVLVRTHDGF